MQRPPGSRGRPRSLPPHSAICAFPGDLGDLRRQAASAGHGGVGPGRGNASAPRYPRGERGRDRSAAPGWELRRGGRAGRCKGSRTGLPCLLLHAPRPVPHSFIPSVVLLGSLWGPGAIWGRSGGGGSGDTRAGDAGSRLPEEAWGVWDCLGAGARARTGTLVGGEGPAEGFGHALT